MPCDMSLWLNGGSAGINKPDNHSSITNSETNDEVNQAVSIGPHSPPIPKKLANKIWRDEFVELSELLPSRLGISQPTLMDVLAPSSTKPVLKHVSSIEEWVMCFNTYIAIVAIKHQRE